MKNFIVIFLFIVLNSCTNNYSTSAQNSWWVGSNADVWRLSASFYYELKNIQPINSFKMYDGYGFPYAGIDNFQLYYSDNSFNWNLALDIKMGGKYALDWRTYNFKTITARYWKLTATPIDKAFSIVEIDFGLF